MMQHMMGTFEAKTHFAQLIERAVQGEETLITRRGKLVAKIVPVNLGHDIEAAKKAAHHLRTLAKTLDLKSLKEEWQDYRQEGRS